MVNLDDVRVVNRGSGAGLAEEPGAAVGVGGECRTERLHRDPPPELFVLRLVDDAHRARTEPADDPEPVEACRNRSRVRDGGVQNVVRQIGRGNEAEQFDGSAHPRLAAERVGGG